MLGALAKLETVGQRERIGCRMIAGQPDAAGDRPVETMQFCRGMADALGEDDGAAGIGLAQYRDQ